MNQEEFEEAYIRANAHLAFVIAEGNRENKRLRNQAIGRVFSPEAAKERRGEREGTRQDELPAHSSRPSNDPGSNVPRVSGSERGVRKVRGSKRVPVTTKKAQKHLKDRLMAKHGKDK